MKINSVLYSYNTWEILKKYMNIYVGHYSQLKKITRTNQLKVKQDCFLQTNEDLLSCPLVFVWLNLGKLKKMVYLIAIRFDKV